MGYGGFRKYLKEKNKVLITIAYRFIFYIQKNEVWLLIKFWGSITLIESGPQTNSYTFFLGYVSLSIG